MDIALRFNKEMLVLSGSVEAGLARLGVDTENDLPIANVLEPETIKDAIAPFVMAGAQCLIANTKDMLQARLAHNNLDSRIEQLASAALKIANSCKPQHVIVELGNCGLPLDDESRFSLNEFKNQYVNSGRTFASLSSTKAGSFDAFLLSDLENTSQIKCALMGIRQVSDKPIFVSVSVDKNGKLNDKEDIYDYAQVLVEYGATIAGIRTDENPDVAEVLCKRLRAGCNLPILMDFKVNDNKESNYYNPDTMKNACLVANKAGAQFLRASGFARPAHSAILAGMSGKMPLNLSIGC